MTRDENIDRIERAENAAFTSLYAAAAACCATGAIEIEGITTVWSPLDDDPGYSCIINLADAADPASVVPRIEDAARAAGARVLGIDGAPEMEERIGERGANALGYERDYQECMWGLTIDADAVLSHGNGGDSVRRIGPAERKTFARIINRGFELADDAVRGTIFASTIELPGWSHYLVSFGGEPGAASALYVTDGVAQLFVAATAPEYRGRGAQTSLIRRRLWDAVEAGCDLATSQTVVYNASPRNMARHGFHALYYRWIYGKQL